MNRGSRVRRWLAAAFGMVLFGAVVPAGPASAEDYVEISGAGSTWALNAINTMQVNVARSMTVNYAGTGSTAGRNDFLKGNVDFAASDIPFQFVPEDGSTAETPAKDSYAYIPIVAGGTSFIYNLKINGKRVTNLRLSGENVAKIFTGVITMWNDPALAADNPGITLPGRSIVPVVRSDGSGSTAQFTMWMVDRHPGIWTDYCHRAGRTACGFTSLYPTGFVPGMIAQAQDFGVANYVTSSPGEGSIGYVNYSYATAAAFPVAKVLNAAGYYTEPTPKNVAVSLLKAEINMNADDLAVYLTQKLDGVYADTDPRNYQLSAYSYFILRTKTDGQFDEAHGRTLAAFAYYAMCQAQQFSEELGYSPIPINLVQASFDQIRKIPGAETPNITVEGCDNPTFSADGGNRLAETAPMPLECDKQNVPTQCELPTGGAIDKTDVTGGGSAYSTQQNPGANPQDPGANPQDPGANPQDPGANPQDPAANPQDPGANPQDPGANPQDPQNDNPQNPSASSSTTVPCDPNSTASTSTPCTTLAPTGSAPGGGTGGEGETTVCDPDTGVCGTATPGGGGDEGAAAEGQTSDRQVDGAKPTTVDDDPGWGLAQTLMVFVVVLLTLAVIVLPAFVWRHLSTRAAPS